MSIATPKRAFIFLNIMLRLPFSQCILRLAFLPVALPLVAAVPTRLAAQRLEPIAVEERCDGRTIAGIEFVGARRPVLGPRLAFVADAVNGTLFALQPQTRVGLIKRFLLLAEGDACDEQRRVESERVLRAQSYISDAVIRVIPHTANEVRLRVETIDEWVLYSEAWGLEGLPAGLEFGTGSVAGTGKGFRLLSELGRGGELGWGAKYRDPQFLGRPVIFDLAASSRPFVDSWSVGLQRPAWTNFQRSAWTSVVASNRGFYTLRDSAIRNVTVEYERSTAGFNGSWRLGPVNAPWHISGSLDWERAQRRRVVEIRGNGPVDIPPPAEVALRYPLFDAARVGVGTSYTRLRFRPFRGLGALSAPEDVAVGFNTWASVQVGIAAFERDETDHVFGVGSYGGIGNEHVLVRWYAGARVNTPRADGRAGEAALNARTTVALKVNEGHLTALTFAGNAVRDARIPTQLTLREDDLGLLGFRTTDFGGAARLVFGIEERHRIPLPTRRFEVALAGLAQTGRLWAGDAPFGVTTPWYLGVGGAVMVALPAGAKQMLRLEVGVPLNGPPGLQRQEVRLTYSDRTGRY